MKRISLFVDAAAPVRGADGSAGHPFPTLEAARDALRRRRASGAIPRGAPVDVLVREGVYRLKRPLSFDARDGGAAEAPVTWRAAGAGMPVVTGGIDLTTGWEESEVDGLACWRRPMPEARGPHGVRFTQLFVGGARRYRARLPREGFWRFDGIPPAEARRDAGGAFHGAMSARLPAEAARALRDPAALREAEFVVPDHWYENHLRAASLRGRTVRFGTRGFSRLSKDETGRAARFRLDNVRAGLTEPGFWFLDRAKGELLYLPLPGEKRNETPVEAPVLPCLLRVAGDLFDPARRVRHLRFEFLDLRAQEWELPRESPGVRQAAFQVPAAVHFEGAEDCALYACRVSRTAGWAVELLRGCRRCRVVACSLRDLGAGGVKIGHEGPLSDVWFDEISRGLDAAALGWGPRASDPRSAPQRPGAARTSGSPGPAAATVADCSIVGGGRLFHSAIGVWCGDAGGCRIVHNEIRDFFYSGVSCGWSWGYMPAHARDNRIEGNRVSDIGHGMLSDMGAVYTLGRQPGTVVARNFVHDVGSYGYGGWGLYADEGTSWARFEENVVLRTRSEGFHQHYGRDNLVRRNLLADSGEAGARLSRGEAFRALSLEGNAVLHPATGVALRLPAVGGAAADVRGNLFAPAPGASSAPPPAGFAPCDGGAAAPDPDGALPSPRLPRGAARGTLSAEEAARIMAEAGPRYRGRTLPASIDDILPEPETTRALLEPVLLAAQLAWRLAGDPADPPDFWKAHDRAGIPCAPGAPVTVSMTLENRGFAPVAGRYRFRVEPAGAARIEGPRTLAFDLAPDGRAGWEATLVPTGKATFFRLVATCSAPDQPGADLRFESPLRGGRGGRRVRAERA